MSRWLQASLKKKSNLYKMKDKYGRYFKCPPIEAASEEEARIKCANSTINLTPDDVVAEEVK